MRSYSSDAMFRFNYLMGETDALYGTFAKKVGLPESEMTILYALCDMGDPCPLTEICRRSCLSKQTLNSALRRMERAGLLYLARSGAKTKDVCLTPEGRQLAGRTAMRVLEMENRVLAGWQASERETYLRLTERFLEEMRKEAKRF